jgi:hypothetical protein
MKPTAAEALAAAIAEVERLADEADPLVGRRLVLVGALLRTLESDIEDSVVWRLATIARIQRLFEAAGALSPDASLTARLRQAVREADELGDEPRLTTLDARLDLLRGALVDLHAWLERADAGAGAAALLAEVWELEREELRRRADGRVFAEMWR